VNIPPTTRSTLFPYTTLFRSIDYLTEVRIMENIRIKDIARLSGVSVATVSRVINNNGRFSEKTRQKVLKVIEETGYQMNYSAKRSEEHTSELQSRFDLVCRLL